MNYYKIFYLAPFFMISCRTSAPTITRIQAKDVYYLQQFATFSNIYSLEKINLMKSSHDLSKKSFDLIEETIREREYIPIKGTINAQSQEEFLELKEEVEYLVKNAQRPGVLPLLKITPKIDSLLELKYKRFGLIILNKGLIRYPENLDLQNAKSQDFGIIKTTSNEMHSTVYAIIVDAYENNIAFYRQSYLAKSPVEKSTFEKHIKQLFGGYFFPKMK